MKRVEPGDLLTVAQALKILPISRTRMYELATSGAIGSIRVPTAGGGTGRVLIIRESLDRYIQERILDRPTGGAREPHVDVDAILADVEDGEGLSGR